MIKNIDKIITRIKYTDNKKDKYIGHISELLNLTEVKIVPVIDESRKKADLVLHIDNSPDMELLGIEFGDIIHNYRSILDNLVINLAIHLGYKKNDKGVKCLSFIICSDESEWNSNKGKLSILPNNFVSLIKQLQPFNDLLNIESKDSLLHLRNINNEDKHYLQVEPSIDNLISNMNLEINVEGQTSSDYKPIITKYKLQFIDGLKIADIKVDYPIKKVQLHSEVKAELVIKTEKTNLIISDILQEISLCVKIITDFFQYTDDSNAKLILMKTGKYSI